MWTFVHDDRMAGKGSAPYGWRWDGRTLVPDEHEAHVRWLVLLLHRQPRSLSQIAAHLEQLGIRTREGATTWPKSTLHKIVSTAAALENTG